MRLSRNGYHGRAQPCSRGWEDFAVGEQSSQDAPIANQLLHNFSEGDLLCGDCAFCIYELISNLLLAAARDLAQARQATQGLCPTDTKALPEGLSSKKMVIREGPDKSCNPLISIRIF